MESHNINALDFPCKVKLHFFSTCLFSVLYLSVSLHTLVRYFSSYDKSLILNTSERFSNIRKLMLDARKSHFPSLERSDRKIMLWILFLIDCRFPYYWIIEDWTKPGNSENDPSNGQTFQKLSVINQRKTESLRFS